MTSIEIAFERQTNPIDLVETIANSEDWAHERSAEDELTAAVAGSWCDYRVSINWAGELEVLHMASAFDLKVPPNRLNEIYRLIALINEQLWLGHFDIWVDEGNMLFRHSLMLNGAEPTVEQCEALVHAALTACERYYQAFQFVIWAGQNASDALAGIMFETEGQA